MTRLIQPKKEALEPNPGALSVRLTLEKQFCTLFLSNAKAPCLSQGAFLFGVPTDEYALRKHPCNTA